MNSVSAQAAPVIEEGGCRTVRIDSEVILSLRKAFSALFQSALLLWFVFVEICGALLTSRVLNPDPPPKFKPMPLSLSIMHSVASLTAGVLITAISSVSSGKASVARAIPETFREVFQLQSILSYSLPAASFTFSGMFSYLTYTRLDAGLKKTLDQLRVPVVALLGTIILGRRYSMQEWFALLIVFLATCTFYFADVEHDEVTELRTKCRYPAGCFHEPPFDLCALSVDGSTIVGSAIKQLNGTDTGTTGTTLTRWTNWKRWTMAHSHGANGAQHDITTFPVSAVETDRVGLIFSLITISCNCVGALFFEKATKRAALKPFPMQKAQMEATGLPIAIAMSFIVPLSIDPQGGKAIWWTKNDAEGSGGGFFQGWSELTLIVLGINIFQTWTGHLIIKQFSALAQKLATCFVVVSTVFLSGTVFKACQAEPLPTTMYALAVVIAVAVTLFGSMAKDKATPTLPRCAPTQASRTSDEPITSGAIQLEDI